MAARLAPTVAEVLASDSVHTWTKRALETSIGRDPLDAYYDALLVAEVLKGRMDAILAGTYTGR